MMATALHRNLIRPSQVFTLSRLASSAEDYAHALVNELEKPAHIKSQMTIAY